MSCAAIDLKVLVKIGVTGFEPATSWSQTRRSTKLSYTPQLRVMLITMWRFAHAESVRMELNARAG